MKFYQSNLLSNIIVFALGLLFIITPTALTNMGMNNTNSFYPDLFICFIFSTALNKPNRINLYLILLLMLLSDVLHMKPIGLLTILMITSFIVIQRYEKHIDKSPFYIHYFIFFITLCFIQILNIFIHHLLFIPKLSLITIFNQTFFTLIFYPIFDIPYKLVRATNK